MISKYSIYLHIPFCIHRCGYCDFNTYAGQEDKIGEYVSALSREIEQAGAAAEQHLGEKLPVHTIFFGGGTPSLLPVDGVASILRALQKAFAWQEPVEVSLEANPGTLSLDYLRSLRALGINRLSLGVQSANPEELRLLERQHDFPDVIRSVKWARQAGFDNLNLDLIFGLPSQSLETWQHTVDLALGLQPDHLSMYALTLEHGTPMAHWAARGLIEEPDGDLAADMYEWASGRLNAAGFCQYEISNWAREEGGEILSCKHNLQYWHNQPYLGLGAGAHGYANGVRTANVLAPATYIKRCLEGSLRPFPLTPATQNSIRIDGQAEIGETLMMGLRLTHEGVSRQEFAARFGRDLAETFPEEIDDLIQKSLVEWGGEQNDRLRLTPYGRLLGNQVFSRFV